MSSTAVDSGCLVSISEFYDPKNNPPYGCHWVDVYKDSAKKKSDKRLMLVATYDFCLFEKKMLSRNLNIIASHKWTELKRLTYSDGSFVLSFGKEEFFIGTSIADEFIPALVNYLYTVFLDEEMPKLIGIVPNKGRKSIVERYKFLINLENKKPKQEILDYLQDFLEDYGNELEFSALKEPIYRNFSVFLRAISFENKIKTLSIPYDGNSSHWGEIGELLMRNSSINRLKSYEPITSEFARVIEAIKENSSSAIIGFTFINPQFTEDSIRYIIELLQHPNIRYLEFENPLLNNKQMIGAFNRAFQSHFTYLQQIIVDQAPGIDFTALLNNGLNLNLIQVSNSEIEISEFFDSLSKLAKTRIESIILNGNSTKKLLNPKLTLPPPVKKIEIGKMEWSGDNFIFAWQLLLQQNGTSPLRLVFSDTTMPLQNWSRFLNVLPSIDSSRIGQLVWNNNPISQDLVNYLKSCPNLSFISVQGCFRRGDTNLSKFSEYISTTKILDTLILSGTQDRCIGEGAATIIDAISQNRSIVNLDVTDQQMGLGKMLLLGAALMKNRVIEYLRYSGNKISTADDYTKFFNTLIGRGIQLQMLFPDNIKKKEYKQLYKLFCEVRSGNAGIEVPAECLRPKEPEPEIIEEIEEEIIEEEIIEIIEEEEVIEENRALPSVNIEEIVSALPMENEQVIESPVFGGSLEDLNQFNQSQEFNLSNASEGNRETRIPAIPNIDFESKIAELKEMYALQALQMRLRS